MAIIGANGRTLLANAPDLAGEASGSLCRSRGNECMAIDEQATKNSSKVVAFTQSAFLTL